MSKHIANLAILALFATALVLAGAAFSEAIFVNLNNISHHVQTAVAPYIASIWTIYQTARIFVIEHQDHLIVAGQVAGIALAAQLVALITGAALDSTRQTIMRVEGRKARASALTRPLYGLTLLVLHGAKAFAFVTTAVLAPFSIPAQMQKDRRAAAALAAADARMAESMAWAVANSASRASRAKAPTVHERGSGAHPQVDLPPVTATIPQLSRPRRFLRGLDLSYLDLRTWTGLTGYRVRGVVMRGCYLPPGVDWSAQDVANMVGAVLPHGDPVPPGWRTVPHPDGQMVTGGRAVRQPGGREA